MRAATSCSTGLVDLVIVGTDRTTAHGDVANKIGTYLKALAARDNGVPFYVALPGSTIDWTIRDGLKEIPIEERSAAEVTHLRGKTSDGSLAEIQVTPRRLARLQLRLRRHPGAPRHRAHHRKWRLPRQRTGPPEIIREVAAVSDRRSCGGR